MERTLYHNATIHTQNSEMPQAGAVVVEHGKFLVVGKESDLLDSFTGSCRRVDVKGQTILPGFNDAHIHLWKVGQLETFLLDLRGIKSIKALQELLTQSVATLPPGTWIMGRGFNEQTLEEKRMPDKKDLDEVSTDHPIYLIRTCAHIASVNSLALKKSGVTETTKVPAGGVMGKDSRGNLNGIFYETALGLITRHIPEPTQEQYELMIARGIQKMLSLGITSITDPAAHPELLKAYRSYCQKSQAIIRLNIFPILLPDGGEKPYPLPDLFHSDFLNIDTVKFFSDGGLSGQTAALSRPYKNSNSRGVLRLQAESFFNLAKEAQQKGFRMATHAIGDTAIELVVETYKKLHKLFGHTRNRIEHFGLPTPAHENDMATYQWVAVPQPVFLHELGENFLSALDETYLARCYPVKSLLQKNIPVAFSTDGPVVSNINPFSNMKDAILRKTASGKVISPDESISLPEALQAYTTGSAFAEEKERTKGKIEKGYVADFIITDKNPFIASTNELDSIRVKETYVNGKCLWKSM
ncbi:MAG: amidohydrolase [Bacteroidetes bacterium]|nr:amidohydrolase [Bacteroidota bacterium]